MIRKFTILCMALLGFVTVEGQKSVEVGVMLGASNYNGDLVETPLQNFHFAGGLVGRFNLNDYFTLKGNVYYGTISGADSTDSREWARVRNLSFKSMVFEFGGNIEWNIFGYDPIRTKKGKAFSPYVFTGISVYKYNPQAYLDGNWIELQPIATEGQGTTQFQERKKYKLTSFALPLGGGIKIRLARNWTLGLEAGVRCTFNDYLDDVGLTYVDPQILAAAYGGPNSNSVRLADRSPDEVRANRQYNPLTFSGANRGNPQVDDFYTFSGITITYTIFGNRVKCFTF